MGEGAGADQVKNEVRQAGPSRAKLLYRLRNCERKWCGRVDSNHHGIATASPSSWCVCQFRHDRFVD